MTYWKSMCAMALLCVGMAKLAFAAEVELSKRSPAELLKMSREAYIIFDRRALSDALVAKGMVALPELTQALENEHWHVRHCALMALQGLEAADTNRVAIRALLPKFTELLAKDPALGVRWLAADCIGGLGEKGRDAQEALARAAIQDGDAWVRGAASTALTAIKADPAALIPLYECMIRSTDNEIRKDGIAKATGLYAQGVDVRALVPALQDVFRKPVYDANFSNYTRVPAMALLLRMKIDVRELVPFIIKDLRTAWTLTPDGYHPYQRLTISMFGTMGAQAEGAIPVLEEVIADPSKFGCSPTHPDYKNFISQAQESINKIRADLGKKGASK